MAPVTQALPLACLLLLLLGSAPGADAQAGQGFQLQQPQKEVSVRVGETLTLSCTVTAGGPPSPMNWLKGWGSGSETIYDQKDPSTWGKRAVNDSNTDFTILIRDVRAEDAGTYYCVKFRKTATSNELYQRGNGTAVLVQGSDAQAETSFQLHQPQKMSVVVGETLTLSCTVTEGGPLGPVKWLKGWGSGSETIYDQKDPSSWGMRAVNDSNTDFTILIRDVRAEDAGTYYCVKFRKTATGEELYQRGNGTAVVVQGADAQAGQGFQLQQPQKISVTAGETLTLSCTVTAGGPIGPVKWLKGWGSGSETIFDQKDPSTWWKRAVNESNTDFSILIRDVRPEDAGTYYCVKFRKTASGDELYRHGKGTEVVVVVVQGAHLLSSPGLWLGILLEKAILGLGLFFFFKRWQA